MSALPDFSSQGYQVIRELGHNYVGGRVTYLATDNKSQHSVVVKQFQFAKSSSSWSGFKAYYREIQVLQGLNHPGIPRYLDAFETANGFCMVQEYKHAQSLAVPRSFAPEEIKQIAIAVLEILVYLQHRLPPVIHRDIKPENILVDEQLHVTLVDFGFARIGGGEVTMSSIALGTLGFMPPEQLYNRQLTAATDLYGLGATIICLLSGTKSTAINQLIDEDGRLNFKLLVSQLSLHFIDWLEKMVQPKQRERYASASAALEALKPIHLIREPIVDLSHSTLEFTATELNQKLVQAIAVCNYVPETLLEGRWEVAPHKSDPPHTPASHAWISFFPEKFTRNQAKCLVTVDTSKLLAAQTYRRTILLHTNSAPATYLLTIEVKTGNPLPTDDLSLALIGGAALSVAGLVATTIALTQAWSTAIIFFALLSLMPLIEGIENLTLIGILVSVGAFTGFLAWMGLETLTVIGALVGFGFGAMSTARVFNHSRISTGSALLFLPVVLSLAGVTAVVGAMVGGLVGSVASFLVKTAIVVGGVGLVTLVGGVSGIVAFKAVGSEMTRKGLSQIATTFIPVLSVWFGVSLGIWCKLAVFNYLVLAAALITGLPLAGMIFYPQFKRSRFITKYRKSEEYLIKP